MTTITTRAENFNIETESEVHETTKELTDRDVLALALRDITYNLPDVYKIGEHVNDVTRLAAVSAHARKVMRKINSPLVLPSFF